MEPFAATDIYSSFTEESKLSWYQRQDPKKRQIYNAKRRVSRRNNSDLMFIDKRAAIARRHKLKKFAGEAITSIELINKHKSQTGKCYYTGLEYQLNGNTKHPLQCTVDRIDNNQGYTKDNTVLCCWFVNCAKNSWPLETIIELWKHLPIQMPGYNPNI